MHNQILRSSVSVLLVSALFFTGLFCWPISGYAATKTEIVTKTEPIHDLAYYDIWKHADGTWQKGKKQKSEVTATFTIPADVIPKGGIFVSCSGQFNNNYNDDPDYKAFAVPSGNLIGTPSYSTANKSVTYTVKTILVTKDSNNGEPRKTSDQMDAVEGYRYYIPVIIDITYKIETTVIPDPEPEPDPVEDLTADLDTPGTVKTEERFTVSDATKVGAETLLESATLWRRIDGGAWEALVTWKGNGKKGQNTGKSIEQSFDTPLVADYKIVSVTEGGAQDERIRSTTVEDGTVVDAEVILSLPSKTYESHPVTATDESTYTVDGERYSALRAYEEKKATNKFSIVESGAGSIRKDKTTPVYATATFPNKGFYNVQLKISPKNGGSLYDTKPIEVLKTPTVLANLGGTQKQNRKQVLTIQVATNADNPLTQLWAEVTNLETGEKVHLAQNFNGKENTLDNSAGIKTRPLEKLESDEYWTNCQLLFLTKNTKETRYQYKVYAKDSRGLWDEVEKEFTVQPDLPPEAKISVPDSFFREKGTNTATIEMEDVSTTDGDQLARSWYITEDSNLDERFEGETEGKAEEKAGFSDSSFGTKKIVSVEKTGVGKVKLRLHVKDVWTEETLEEYITDADYLTAETTATTKVDNIAPIVSLKPIPSRTADILLLAGTTEEYYKLKNGINTMQSYFLGNAIDADITVKRIGPASAGENLNPLVNSEALHAAFFVDQDNLYVVDGASVTERYGDYTFSPPFTLKAIQPQKGNALWSYTFAQSAFSSNFAGKVFFDENGQYVYVVGEKKTHLLEKENGAYLTTLEFEMGEKNFVEGDFIYTFKTDGIYQVNRKTGAIKQLLQTSGTGGAVKKIQKELHFLTIQNNTLKRGIFNLKTQAVRYEAIEKVKNSGNLYFQSEGICIDSEGNLLVRLYYKNNQEKNYVNAAVFTRENQFSREIHVGIDENAEILPILDEEGRLRYVSYVGKQNGSKYKRIMVYCHRTSDGTTLSYTYENRSGYETEDLPLYGKIQGDTVFILTPQTPYAVGAAGGYYEVTKVTAFDFQTSATEESSISVMGLTTGVQFFKQSSHYAAAEQNNKINLYQKPASLNQLILEQMKRELAGKADLRLTALFDETNQANGDTFQSTIKALSDFGYQFVQITEKAASYGETIRSALDGIKMKSAEFLTGMPKLLTERTEQGSKTKIVVSQTEGKMEKTLLLEKNKKYYYEYELKKEGDTKEQTDVLKQTPILAKTIPEALLSSSVYPVSKSFTEDFNDTNYNPYFTLDEKGEFTADYHFNSKENRYASGRETGRGNYGAYQYLYETRSASLSRTLASVQFTIAAGEKGVLSFDYSKGLNANFSKESEILIDGKPAYIEQIEGDGSYTHPVVLSSGIHEITLNSGTYGRSGLLCYAMIDNVRVDYLGAYSAAQTSEAVQTGGDTKITGSFTASPEITAYQAVKNASAVTDFAPQDGSVYTTPGGQRMEQFMVEATMNPPDRTNYSIQVAYDGKTPKKDGMSYQARGTVKDNELPYFNGNYIFTAQKGRSSYTLTATEGVQLHRVFYSLFPTNYPKTSSYFEAGGLLYDAVQKYDDKTTVSLVFPKGTYYLQNFKVYTFDDAGNKQYVDNAAFKSQADLSVWKKTNLIASVIADNDEKEDPSLVYKKGELVSYGISYYDYESDPSKKQYWRYTHTPFNDGAHPDAATVLNEDGNITSQNLNKVLNQPIQRFYVDGKYTVEHWQEDDTSRGSKVGGNSLYDKPSNVESLTFYIEGGGSAPWITSIKTVPTKVTEGEAFQIQVGVNDAEKDELRLTTEVYKDKKLLYTHRKTGLNAVNGSYPLTTTGTVESKAQTGTYEVVCTVRDQTGAGIGTYRFTVLSEGKITGMVYHTENWEKNRKTYNLKRFKDEGNQEIPYADYVKQKAPRKRGTNVFWSGEKFMLQAEVAGSPSKVTCKIEGYPAYSTTMKSTGKKNAANETIYSGSLWDSTMLNKWGRKTPKELTFTFTATYSAGTTKTYTAKIIVDSQEDYWQLHRAF